MLVQVRLAFERENLVVGEHDLGSALGRGLGDDVDRSRLDLGQEHFGVDLLQLLAERCPVGEVARDVDDLRVEVVDRRGPGREHGDAPARNRLDRAQAQLDADHRHVLELADRLGVAAADEQDEVGDQHAVRVQVGGCVLPRPDDEDPCVHGDRRDRRTAPVEDREVRSTLLDELGAAADVRREDLSRKASPGPPAADRRHPGERGSLEVVGRRVTPCARDLEQRVERRSDLDDLGLGGPAPAHRDDDHVQTRGEEPCDMPGNRCLADPLPGPEYRERRNLAERQIRGRLELEVRPDVRLSESQCAARPEHPLARAEDRLVREVDDRLGGLRVLERVEQRHAVLLPTAELLRAAEEDRSHEVERQLGERVAHDVRVVLAVDERDRLHECVVTSDSIRAVYFSKASVSVENWMIFSCPWKGYLRQTSTCAPVTSTRL